MHQNHSCIKFKVPIFTRFRDGDDEEGEIRTDNEVRCLEDHPL